MADEPIVSSKTGLIIPPEAMLPVPDFPIPEAAPTQPAHIDGWNPLLNPTQQRIFDCLARYILMYGEKGSGKSVGGLHSLVRHCYEEDDALALIMAPAIRTGAEGVMYDLMWVLDIWKNGNWNPDKPGERLDDGMGLDFTEPKLDPNTKDRCVFIGNMHGGWSKVILMSIPYAEVVTRRMKGLSPSFIYVDEITELDSKVFFTYVAAQLGRRRGIKGPQQYQASCNPEGPSHWVYEVFWVDCVNEEGIRDQDFSVFHVRIHENKRNLPPGYIEGLEKLYKDPMDHERLIKGRWVDRPSGEAIFRLYFRPEIHIRGDLKEKPPQYLTPKPGIPLLVSYDPGPVNFCVAFLQMIPTKQKTIWIQFDELNFVGQFVPDFVVVPRILERMDYWKAHPCMKGNATFVHIADEASFTQKRPDGSYDASRIQQLSKGRIRMRACPKGKESVPQRVQMFITMFLDDAFFISTMCPKTIEMLRLLVSEMVKPGKYDAYKGLRPQRSAYLHPFDATSYAPFYFSMVPSAFALQTDNAAPQVYRAGGGT